MEEHEKENATNRAFKGIWIPSEVWLDVRLSALDKIILMEIDSLDGERGCFASNKAIAEFCQCSESKVSLAISKLTKLGYLHVISFDGRVREIGSCLSKFNRRGMKVSQAECENLEENNINKNNIYYSLKKKNNKKEKSPPPITDEAERIEAIVASTEAPLQGLIRKYIRMREHIKSPVTSDALEIIISRLHEYSGGDADKARSLLEDAILNNWKNIYPPKATPKAEDGQGEQKSDLDDIFT